MTGYLLDTTALIWLLADSAALGPGARAAINSGTPVHFSAISTLETTIQTMLGKLDLPGDIAAAARRAGLDEVVFTSVDAARLNGRPDLVRHDPFDRMLLAQADRAGLTLITSDQTLLALPDADVLDARS